METTEHRSCAYGLRHQTRCLSAIKSTDGKSRFIIGTQELLKPNEIHLLTFDEDMFEISTTIFSHPLEIWDISASRNDPDLFFTCHKQVIDGKKIESKASLWRMKLEQKDPDELDLDHPHHQLHGELEHVLTLEGDGTVKKVIWQDSTEVISVEDRRICIWDIDVKQGTAKMTGSIDTPDKNFKFTSAVINPHSQEVVAVYGRSIQGWNLSSLKPTFAIKDLQPALLLCIDYNPNRPFQIATGGDDCKVRIWDVRDPTSGPIMTIQDHTHCIVSISTGADYKYGDTSDVEKESDDDEEINENGPQEAPTDGLVQAFDQHEDSVYQVAWSSVDPWLFMSLSYDGRAVMNQVPSEEKFKIIMN
ncbi:Protein tssc1 [Entomortierella beljakovae]|nr:Protein tssc1 [Entomortierella beljakovae]